MIIQSRNEEKKPLNGQRILITRDQKQSNALSQKIESLGGKPLILPLIRIVKASDLSKLDRALEHIEAYKWIIFTSVNAVIYFFQYVIEGGLNHSRFQNVKWVAVGAKTKATMERYGVEIDICPAEFQAEAVIQELQFHVNNGDGVLFPCSSLARRTIPNQLTKMGCQVTEVIMYQTLTETENAEQIIGLLSEDQIDMITLTSPSTARSLVQLVQAKASHLWEKLQQIPIACIGPVTAEALNKLGLVGEFHTSKYTIEGLVDTLIQISSLK
ncbi:uroporphyrinogen-III synthase [Hazenella sp. IB182357]|uniref:Uroporphyrinogen-III synthase n=1 Tax=Polycladospora coralii TaxID=2771432 RepID=A0A926N8L1_9BACL|nr:uroporphyrinogen-III synthase [Polycladospora coralii]MBD1371797.1 uroporphyrinogen-III synthase [Polycladospora coralii]MBS7529258.1 uroporphyrinogen-III synthase [Polycladospora coralii]